MAIFTVMASSDPAAVKAAIASQYGANHYEFSPNIWFVPDVGTSKTVADKIGITDGRIGATGVVLLFSGYSGWASSALWTWLQQFPEIVPNG